MGVGVNRTIEVNLSPGSHICNVRCSGEEHCDVFWMAFDDGYGIPYPASPEDFMSISREVEHRMPIAMQRAEVATEPEEEPPTPRQHQQAFLGWFRVKAILSSPS